MSRPDVIVTDRAILRYLEKIEGVDMRPIRRRIEKAARLAIEHGASGVTVEGVTYKLDETRVTTVAPVKRRRIKVVGNG